MNKLIYLYLINSLVMFFGNQALAEEVQSQKETRFGKYFTEERDCQYIQYKYFESSSKEVLFNQVCGYKINEFKKRILERDDFLYFGEEDCKYSNSGESQIGAYVYYYTEWPNRPDLITTNKMVCSGYYIKQEYLTYYSCPSTHPYITETYEDGQPKTCSNIEPVCDCTEDLVDNQCTSRTPDYSGGETGYLHGDLYEISDENNQGLKCGLLVPDKDPCASDAAQTPIPWVENPINCTNGVKRQTETDYSSSVGGIRLARTYSSMEVEEETLERAYKQAGEGLPDNIQLISYRDQPNVSYHEWQVEGLPFLNIDTRFSGLTFGRLSLPNGTTLTYTRDSSSTGWERYSLKDGTLEDEGTGFKFTSPNGTVYQFDSDGKLTSKTYRNGQSHSITYPAANHAVITDSFNRSADIYYEDIPQTLTLSKRVITKFVDPAGNEYRYEHDNKGFITKVIYPDETPGDWSDNPFKQYLYDDRTYTKVLTGIVDENGEQYATYGYDAKNRAVSTEHAGGAIKATIDYLDSTELGETTADESSVKFYRDGTNYREAVYHHKIYNGINKITKLEQKPCPDCVVGDYTYEYDENGFLSQATTPDGEVSKYVYNLRGLLESKTEAFGTAEERTVTTTWHSSYKLPLTVDQPQRLTTYSYDANGNLLSRSVKDKATNETRTVSYTYNGFGQVLTVDGPRTDVSDVTTYEYDTSGNLTKITNALGHETLITSHDAHGKPLSITDPNGTVTTLSYLPRGWLTSMTTAGDSTTYSYDKAGQLTSVTMANGVVLNYEYDAAHRLTAIVDSAGNRIEYTLDSYGNRTRTDIKDATGTIKSYAQQVYNDLGQLKQTVGANNQVNDFDYDAEGKPTQSEDALDNPTTQHFDALDRLQKVVDPALGETEFGYDSQDRLTSVTDATDKTTSYQYNAFGDVLSITSPDTGTTSMTYDSAGNVLTTTDARNITATYTYDALNRVTHIDYPGTTEDLVFIYDSIANGNKGVGRLTQITDESGSTAYEHDAKGQLVAVTRTINGISFTTGYAYDDAGLITQVTYPSGRTVDHQRNNLGQITGMTTTVSGQTSTVANNISYLPFGPLTDLTYGNGKVLTQSFDQDYRLTSKNTTGLYQLGYGYTPRNNINAITDALDSSKNQSFSYDVLARLTDASGQYGIQNYSFDAIGNRLTKTQDGVTESYTYSSTSHRLDSVGSTNLTYDAAGNTLTKGDLTFTYNQVGRLATASKTGMNASYTYNAQGQRVKKTVDDGTTTVTTLYHYDQGGQLIAETDGQGSVRKEYLYLDGMRIATVDSGTLYYVHTDHLGAPLALTDSSGTVQWKGSYDPYGNVTVEVNNLDQTQRFPGQRYSAETGLHYNYFRDYDPEIGRYLQSDPIELNGGINTYGYVSGNPANYVDPLGLKVVGDWVVKPGVNVNVDFDCVPGLASCIRPPELSKGDFTFDARVRGEASITFKVRCTDTCSGESDDIPFDISLHGQFDAIVEFPIPGVCGAMVYTSTRLVRNKILRNRYARLIGYGCMAAFIAKANQAKNKAIEAINKKAIKDAKKHVDGILREGSDRMCKALWRR